ncbi:MAG TPA: EamA family transporter [Solirubrobacteraceae bacterium]|jgi:inner membrane transporter RhtA|nr:EamA family transporter [Solirubrobacteraceae bacterium]
MKSLSRVPSGVLVVGSIGSVQFGSALAATLFAEIGPGGIVFLRLLFAALILLVLWRPRPSEHSHSQLVLAAVFGLVLAGMNGCFYESLDRIPLGIAVALEFVGPMTVALLGSRRSADLFWVALAVVGILALTRPSGHGLDGTGIALALIAGCFWGVYIVLNARLGRAFESGSGLALAMAVGAVVAAPLGIGSAGAELLHAQPLLLGACVGVLSSVIPYSFEVEALRRIAPPVFGVLMSLEPGMAALAGLFVLGQHLSPRAVAGIALVAVASVGASRRGPELPLPV